LNADPDDVVTRREFEALREDFRRMDDYGTRGVQAMQSQMADLVRDIMDLKSDMSSRFDAHQRVHDKDEEDRRQERLEKKQDRERERAERRSGRRWIITTGIAMVVMIVGVLGVAIDILSRTH
jgi:hypothetical protein